MNAPSGAGRKTQRTETFRAAVGSSNAKITPTSRGSFENVTRITEDRDLQNRSIFPLQIVSTHRSSTGLSGTRGNWFDVDVGGAPCFLNPRPRGITAISTTKEQHASTAAPSFATSAGASRVI